MLQRGTANMMLNKLDEAVNDYTKALVLKPDDWSAYIQCYRAHTYFLKGDNEKAY